MTIRQELDEVCRRKKQQMLRLIEVLNLTEQLAQAVERRDQVSIDMLLALRGDPLAQATEVDDAIEVYLHSLSEDSAIRIQALLQGEPAQQPEEEALSAQVTQNRRLLEKIAKVDREVSLRLDRSRSFYNRFREDQGGSPEPAETE